MVLPIYLYGHPVLRTTARPVTPDEPNLDRLIQNMKDTMYGSDGIGIAAPQVGHSLRLVYIDVDVLKDDIPELAGVNMVLINPVITVDETAPVVLREEGCLSVPGVHEAVERHERIHLHYTDENWQEHDMDIEGYLARVVQHECDHLDKTLFVDRVPAYRKVMIRSKLNNIARGNVSCDYPVRVAPIHGGGRRK